MRTANRRIAGFLTGLIATLVAGLAIGVAGAGAFEIVEWDGELSADAAGTPATQAGSHPYALRAKVVFPVTEGFPPLAEGDAKDAAIELPAGLTANPQSVSECSFVDFFNDAAIAYETGCPDNSAIGTARVGVFGGLEFAEVPVYNMVPDYGEPAKLAFRVLSALVFIHPSIRSEGDYGTTVTLTNTSEALAISSADVTLWGVPGDSGHDKERGSCLKFFGGPTGSCPFETPASKIPPAPFLSLPGRCSGALPFPIMVNSWQEPGVFHHASWSTHDSLGNPVGVAGCERLDFAPSMESRLSTDQAETGSGLELNVDFKDEGLLNPKGTAQSVTKKAVVTLPEGVTINPSVGEGLGVCTPAELGRETLRSAPGEGCPDAAKIGVLDVGSPLVDEKLDGSIFLAQQDDPSTTESGAENPFDSLIAMYFVIKSKTLGTLVKLPVKVEPDSQTGRLLVTLDDLPQIPLDHFSAQLREGARAPLVTPPACGTYRTKVVLTPWASADAPRTLFSDVTVNEGLRGGPCPPGGIPPFNPKFEAGSINNNAGSHSPFDMRLIREDGEQDMTKFSAILPPGVVGSLVGIEKCPDAAVAAAKAKTGRQELASPSCPANSEIGHTLAGAGVGGALTYVPGKIYLGGAYHGDPLSVIAITPAVAGPFDAGTVAVRMALNLNPKTAEVEVDGAASDPIPHILEGIVLKLRDLRVYVDRPNFILNPTSCDESSARSTLFGSYLNVFDPGDDVPVDLQARYQAANCLNLGFKPKLGLRLKGGTKRGAHPGLRAVYSPRAGDANIKGLVTRLPRSAFLDQAHIRTICTRVQFAADNCPKAAQYGYIRAWTPLLEEPLQGPAYLRSSNHKLPDLVFDLHGLVDVEVSTRLDSFRGGIRATVEDAPDAPLSRVVLRMQGGKKGLIVNSRNLCARKSKANVRFNGHNGKQSTTKPVVRAQCKKKRKAKRSAHRRARVAASSSAG